jgi:hypothetical protein
LLPRLGLKPMWAAAATAAVGGAGATFARGPAKMACGGAAAAAVARLVQLWIQKPAKAEASAHVGGASILELAIDDAIKGKAQQQGNPPPQPSPLRGEGVELTAEERVKFEAVMRELPKESRRAVVEKLSRMERAEAVAYLRDLFERHTHRSERRRR